MTRGRETNIAYIYERATEQEYGLDQLQGAHVMGRPNSDHAGRLLRAIIANHDQPVTGQRVGGSTTAAQRRSNAGGQPTKSGKQTRKASPGLRPRHESAAAATVGTTVATTGSRRINARLAPPNSQPHEPV
jgi:hypothetical protein